MKNILLVLISLVLLSCEVETTIKCVEMQKVNGEWISGCYDLPINGYFYINSNRGSYSLKYKGEGFGGDMECRTVIGNIYD